jgi:type VI secretion system secreted protein VgrG
VKSNPGTEFCLECWLKALKAGKALALVGGSAGALAAALGAAAGAVGAAVKGGAGADAVTPAPGGSTPAAGGSTPAAASATSSGPLADPQVQALVSKSPTLQNDLNQLKAGGWKIQYGPAGGGSDSAKSAVPPRITLDQNLSSDPKSMVQTLAHEVGHAKNAAPVDYSSKANYVKYRLADEGAATLNNIAVRKEILANGGADIGLAGNAANHPAYNAAYNQYEAAGKTEAAAAKARETIGNIFGASEKASTTKQPYKDYYESIYPGPRK